MLACRANALRRDLPCLLEVVSGSLESCLVDPVSETGQFETSFETGPLALFCQQRQCLACGCIHLEDISIQWWQSANRRINLAGDTLLFQIRSRRCLRPCLEILRCPSSSMPGGNSTSGACPKKFCVSLVAKASLDATAHRMVLSLRIRTEATTSTSTRWIFSQFKSSLHCTRLVRCITRGTRSSRYSATLWLLR